MIPHPEPGCSCEICDCECPPDPPHCPVHVRITLMELVHLRAEADWCIAALQTILDIAEKHAYRDAGVAENRYADIEDVARSALERTPAQP